MAVQLRTLEEFTQKLADELAARIKQNYGMTVSPESRKVQKTNVQKQGITVHFPDSPAAPTVYTDDMYQSYLTGEQTIPEIANNLSGTVYEAYQATPELPVLTPEEARKHVTLTLVNSERNQEMLDHTPHMELLDGELSAVPRWMISDNASFVVTNEVASQIGLTSDEMLQIGQDHINNQHFEVRSMRDILSEMMGEDMGDLMQGEGPEMLVLTSESKIQGSNVLLSNETLDQVHDQIGDFVVLPSSIHEVIAVPINDDMKADELRQMVQEVNGSQVAPEERLSDNVMKYDGEKLRLVGDSLKMDAPKMESPKVEHEFGLAM